VEHFARLRQVDLLCFDAGRTFRDIYRTCYSYSRVLEEDLKASPNHLF
jgi:hypothetical protein